jgi:hypothetical protein
MAVKAEDLRAIGRAAKVELRAATTSSSVCGCESFDDRLDDHEILIVTLIEDSEAAILAFAPAHSPKSFSEKERRPHSRGRRRGCLANVQCTSELVGADIALAKRLPSKVVLRLDEVGVEFANATSAVFFAAFNLWTIASRLCSK